MELKDLAPWIAIAITLSLSILVPVFTQIANNKHQRKLQQNQFLHDEKEARKKVFENFLSEVGGLISSNGRTESGSLSKAGAALHRLYIYAPKVWFKDLDRLSDYLMDCDWEGASPILLRLDRLIAAEMDAVRSSESKGKIK